jgi:hypothetical protein
MSALAHDDFLLGSFGTQFISWVVKVVGPRFSLPFLMKRSQSAFYKQVVITPVRMRMQL